MEAEIKKILNLIAQVIFDKKGFNILALDLTDVCEITDYMVIAEGNVDRHVKALASAITEEVKKEFNISPYQVEGKADGDWIVIDYHNIIVHLFMPYVREKYQIEQLWSEGKVIELEIDVEKT